MATKERQKKQQQKTMQLNKNETILTKTYC